MSMDVSDRNLNHLIDSDEEEDEDNIISSVGGIEQDGIANILPKDVLARLEKGWINEKLAPDLLPPLEEEKDAMLIQIKVMEKNIEALDKTDMRTDIHKLELERIKFVVVSYMRVRLFKLQGSSWHYYEMEMKRVGHKPSILFPEEFTFINGLVSRTEEYYKRSLLDKMPTPLQKFERKKFKTVPSLDSYVFFRVIDPHEIEVEDAHEQVHQVSLGVEEQYVMRYHPVSQLVANESVYLT